MLNGTLTVPFELQECVGAYIFTPMSKLLEAIDNFSEGNVAQGPINCWNVIMITDMTSLFEGLSCMECIICY